MSAPLAQRVVALAAATVGMKETGGPNRGPPVIRFAGGREEPWCAHFVATLYREVGRALPGDIEPHVKQHNPIARVQTMWERIVEAGWQAETPRAGDVIVFNSRVGSDRGFGWHCGIVSTVSSDGEVIQTIEGNSGDAVARRSYGVSDHRIVGFARAPT